MFKKLYPHLLLVVMCGFLAGCFAPPPQAIAPVYTVSCTPAPKKATSRPYQIKGIWYHPQPHFEYEEVGIASYYGGGDVFHGRPTATGERFDMNGLSAAHKTIPLPCIAEVTNLENGRQINIKVNDRGPFIDGRIIDVSRRVAQLLGFERKGTARVRVRTLVPESLALNGLSPPIVMLAESGPAGLSIASLIPDTFPSPSPQKIDYVATPSSPSRGNSTGIFIDVGGYTTQAQAHEVCKKISNLGNSPLQPIEKRGEKPYVVRMGPFPSMIAANEVLDQLGGSGHLSRLVIIRP